MESKFLVLLIYAFAGAALAIAVPIWDHWRSTVKSPLTGHPAQTAVASH